ncbi:MAG: pssL [Hyphomicrobiales bacterium]|nr:pssL [Hyphomicrobiales bacterium]
MATLGQYLSLVVSFAMIAIVSRLLTPAEVGLAVIGMGMTTIVFSLREFATSDFLIQLETVERVDSRTAFSVVFVLSLLLGAGLFLASPWVAMFYGDGSIRAFLELTILASLVEAIGLPTFALLRRDMAFGTITWVRTLGGVVLAAATIAFAALGYGYLSFAIGSLIGGAATVTLVLAARPAFWIFRPTFISWRKMVDFGRYKGATAVIERAYEALPQMVLGHTMPSAAVGVYNRASAIAGLPDRVLLSSIFSVAFPALAAEVREGRDIRDSYLKAISYITVLYWPAALMVAILATPLVRIVLGDNWLETVPFVRILAMATVFWFPVILTYPLLIALGANREAFVSNIVSRALSAIVLCSASFSGLTAMALSQFLSLPLQTLISLYFVRRHVPFELRQLFEAILPSGLVTLAAVAGPLLLVGVKHVNFDLSIPETLLACGLSALGWFAALVATRHPFLAEVVAGFRDTVGRAPWPSMKHVRAD